MPEYNLENIPFSDFAETIHSYIDQLRDFPGEHNELHRGIQNLLGNFEENVVTLDSLEFDAFDKLRVRLLVSFRGFLEIVNQHANRFNIIGLQVIITDIKDTIQTLITKLNHRLRSSNMNVEGGSRKSRKSRKSCKSRKSRKSRKSLV